MLGTALVFPRLALARCAGRAVFLQHMPVRPLCGSAKRDGPSQAAQSTISGSFADLTGPPTWYPHARRLRRRVVYHMGPPNSGKTHAAADRLAEADSGLYCGPLRLLAWEMFERLNGRGVPCDLVTGQERELVPNSRHSACTVEMTDTTRLVSCAVIDEVQMIGDEHRGWAWTRALLGVPAKELHICGDGRALHAVRELLASTGDTLEERHYERLTPLTREVQPLGSVKNVREGDAVVVFSRREVYRLKRDIERSTGQLCTVVYGALPPRSRQKQAKLFNSDESGYGVLVATDAIGMGLNLNIRRIVFSALEKFDGTSVRPLRASEIRQIAGRAGRFGTRFEDGYVTCIHGPDMELLADALDGKEHAYRAEDDPIESISRAFLFPPEEQLELYARSHDPTTLSQTLRSFADECIVDSSLYEVSNLDDACAIADAVEGAPLAFRDKLSFCMAPVDTDSRFSMTCVRDFAHAFGLDGIVPLRRALAEIPAAYLRTPPTSRSALEELEEQHQVLDVYIWLARRLGSDYFADLERAITVRNDCADVIEQGLEKLSAGAAAFEDLLWRHPDVPRQPGRSEPSRSRLPLRSSTKRRLDRVNMALEIAPGKRASRRLRKKLRQLLRREEKHAARRRADS